MTVAAKAPPARPLRPGRDVEAFVLAGGGSRRFGTDKALALLDGRTMLARVQEPLRGLGFTPRVVAHRALDYRGFASAFVMGERADRGPVEGIRVALRACAAPWALVVGVDMPGVTEAALGILLLRAAEDAGRIHCFGHGDRRHPFPGMYPRDAGLALLDQHPTLEAVQELLGLAGAPVAWPGDPEEGARVFRNVNTPRDFGSATHTR